MNDPSLRKRGGSKTPEKAQLTRDDWLDAAAGAVAAGGFGHLRVLTLSKKLGDRKSTRLNSSHVP